MWGFIVTLFALTMDDWGAIKLENEDTIKKVLGTFCMSTLNPLYSLCGNLWQIVHGRAMVANLREALGDDVIALLYPWRKSHIKIILGCTVIVNLSPNVYEEINNFNAFKVEECL